MKNIQAIKDYHKSLFQLKTDNDRNHNNRPPSGRRSSFIGDQSIESPRRRGPMHPRDCTGEDKRAHNLFPERIIPLSLEIEKKSQSSVCRCNSNND